MKAFSKRTPESIYLEYFNEWMLIDEMAAHYSVPEDELTILIAKGSKENRERLTKENEQGL